MNFDTIRRRSAAVALFCFLTFLPFVRQADAAPLNVTNADYVSVPLIKGKQNQLVLRLPMDGHTASIALDTGSPITCVDESKSKLFKLASTSTATSPPLSVMVNGMRHRVATIPMLDFGDLQVQNVPAVLVDLGELNRVLRARHDRQNDAILGLDALHALHAVIDCGGQRLLMLERSDTEGRLEAILRRGGWREIPMRMREGHLVVSGAANRIPVDFIVDTGSPVSVLDQGFCENHRIGAGKQGFALKAIHFETKQAKISRINDLRIGRQDLGQKLVAVFDVDGLLRSNAAASSNQPAGLLGSRTLQRAQAFIDCDNMKLYLKPPATKPSDWEF